MNSYCKLFKCPQKLDINFEEVNELLLSNYNDENFRESLTHFYNYGIQDVIVLETLINTANTLSELTALASLIKVSIRQLYISKIPSLITDLICNDAIDQGILFKTWFCKLEDGISYEGGYNYKLKGSNVY